MASITAKFSNVEVYPVTKMKVKVGEKFTIQLDDQEGETRWLVENDPVLTMRRNGNTAEVTVHEAGDAAILMFDPTWNKTMEVTIKAVDGLDSQATRLNPNPGKPEDKNK